MAYSCCGGGYSGVTGHPLAYVPDVAGDNHKMFLKNITGSYGANYESISSSYSAAAKSDYSGKSSEDGLVSRMFSYLRQ